MPIWLVSLLAFFAIGIPFFFLLYLGLKILVTNLKSIGNIAKFSLLGLWLISIILLIVFGIREAASHAYSGSVTTENEFVLSNPTDTLHINQAIYDYNRDNQMHMGDMIITHDDNGKKMLVSEDVRFRIKKSKDSVYRIEIRKEANGPSFDKAKETAERINYSYTLEGNALELNNFLSTSGDTKFNDQEVRVNLFIPEGTILTYDKGEGRSWIMNANTDRDVDHLDNYVWEMDKNGELTCLDCPDEMEYESSNDNRIRINENGIDININDNGEKGKIIINENGIDIDVNDNGESFKMKVDENGVKIDAKDGDTTVSKTITKD